MAEHFIKLENKNNNNNKSIIDLNKDLNESFREFADPIIDTSLSLEETMERFLKQKDLPSGRNWHDLAP